MREGRLRVLQRVPALAVSVSSAQRTPCGRSVAAGAPVARSFLVGVVESREFRQEAGWCRARRSRRRAMIRGAKPPMRVDLRNRHRDHAYSGRRARSVRRPTEAGGRGKACSRQCPGQTGPKPSGPKAPRLTTASRLGFNALDGRGSARLAPSSLLRIRVIRVRRLLSGPARTCRPERAFPPWQGPASRAANAGRLRPSAGSDHSHGPAL